MRDESKSKDQLIEELRQLREEVVSSVNKQTEHDLHLYNEITNNISEGISLTRARDGVIIYANREFERMLGYNSGELIKQHISIVNAPTEKNPEETVEEVIRELEKTGVWKGEVSNIKKDGTLFLSHVTVSAFEHHEYGKVWVGVQRNITERKQLEEALAKKQAQHAEAQRLAQLGHWELDLVNNTVNWSDETYRIYGLELGTPNTYETFLAIVHPDDRKLVNDAYTASVKNRTPYNIEHRLLMQDGSVKWLNGRCKTEYAEDGRPLRSIGTTLDITERKQLEEQLIQSQKMEAIGVLVGGIAHDFNNMLAGIVGNVDLAMLYVEDDQMRDHLETINKLSMGAADTIKQMLTFARKDRLERQTFSLTHFMKDAMKLAATAIPENIEHSCEIPPEELCVYGDSNQLQQVLMNLINNAKDALEGIKDGKITCSLKPFTADNAFKQRHPACQGDSFACLAVMDNGPGIPEAVVDKMFDPFFTTKEVGKGSGLGLSMVYGAVESHKGVIEVDSVLGKRSTFNIYLPLVKAVAENQKVMKQGIEKGKNELILIADDEDSVRQIYEQLVRALGYRVISACNGEEAVSLFKQNRNEISLVILDIVMPVMGGPDAAKRIRQLHPHLPVIFASGYDSSTVPKLQNDISGYYFMNKPFSLKNLSTTIKKALE